MLTVVVALTAACGSAASSSGPPADTAICGTNLGQNWPDVVYDAMTSGPGATYYGSDTGVFIRVAKGCAVGATVSLSPARRGKIVREALARDGRPVVVVVTTVSLKRGVHLVATRNGHQVAAATIR